MVKFCPKDLHYTLKNQNKVLVSWPEPVFVDNVDIKQITSTQKNNVEHTPITFNVAYDAIDTSGNIATCQFSVHIKGEKLDYFVYFNTKNVNIYMITDFLLKITQIWLQSKNGNKFPIKYNFRLKRVNLHQYVFCIAFFKKYTLGAQLEKWGGFPCPFARFLFLMGDQCEIIVLVNIHSYTCMKNIQLIAKKSCV